MHFAIPKESQRKTIPVQPDPSIRPIDRLVRDNPPRYRMYGSSPRLVPRKAGEMLFAGHLVTGRIQNLLPADGAQSFLVCAALKEKRTC